MSNKIKGIIDYTGAAIYSIVDDTNGKLYIGSSDNVSRRIKQHNYVMKTGRCSTKLQKAVDSGHVFHAEVLEEIPAGKDYFYMFEREAEWIKKLDTIRLGYNTAKTTASSREELEQSLKHFKPNSVMYQYICDIIKKRERIIRQCNSEERIILTLSKDRKADLQLHAEQRGESLNGFIGRAIEEQIKRDIAKE